MKKLSQTTLTEKPLENIHSAFYDPAFTENRNEPIHRWVPWVAGYSSKFVKDALDRYGPKRKTVLDPFLGVGTTLIESVLHGDDSIGFEINPYAVFVSKNKAFSYEVDLTSFQKEIKKYKKFITNIEYSPITTPPKGFRSKEPFYSPKVLKKVLILLDFINNIEDDKLKQLFLLAFGSTMVSYSNYTYEPSLGTRTGAGKEKIIDYDVHKSIIIKLNEIKKDVKYYKDKLKNSKKPEIKIYEDSFLNYNKYLMEETIDLVITSPPYINNYHYSRNTRPQMFWLNLIQNSDYIKTLDNLNIGTFWQVARDKKEVLLNFTLDDSDLQSTIDLINEKYPEKEKYGGKGWANYVSTYFNDTYKFLEGLNYSLKTKGYALIVIGNSNVQGVNVSTDRYLSEIANKIGLKTVNIDIPRNKRIGNSTKKNKVKLYESVVVLTK